MFYALINLILYLACLLASFLKKKFCNFIIKMKYLFRVINELINECILEINEKLFLILNDIID